MSDDRTVGRREGTRFDGDETYRWEKVNALSDVPCPPLQKVNNDEETASGHQICSSLMRSLRSWRRSHRLGQWAAFNGGRGQEVKSQRASCGEGGKNRQSRYFFVRMAQSAYVIESRT